jgi:hypothetical protein
MSLWASKSGGNRGRTPRAEPPTECPNCEHQAAALRERDAALDELRRINSKSASIIDQLSGKVGELEAALESRGGASDRDGTTSTDRYKLLKIAIGKHLHPDTAPLNSALGAELERRFKAVRAEIDRIDAA